jgi:hypothetical protein
VDSGVLTVEGRENLEHVKELADFLVQRIPIFPSIYVKTVCS